MVGSLLLLQLTHRLGSLLLQLFSVSIIAHRLSTLITLSSSGLAAPRSLWMDGVASCRHSLLDGESIGCPQCTARNSVFN